jgi:hypothetical protein
VSTSSEGCGCSTGIVGLVSWLVNWLVGWLVGYRIDKWVLTLAAGVTHVFGKVSHFASEVAASGPSTRLRARPCQVIVRTVVVVRARVRWNGHKQTLNRPIDMCF